MSITGICHNHRLQTNPRHPEEETPNTHVRISKILLEGIQLKNCYFFCFFIKLMRGEGIQIPLIAGHYWPTSKMQFKWRFADGPMMAHLGNIECWLGSFVIFQGIRTSIAKEPFSFVIFWGFQTPCPPSLWICT